MLNPNSKSKNKIKIEEKNKNVKSTIFDSDRIVLTSVFYILK